MTGVLTKNAHHIVAANHFALLTNLFHTWSYFHFLISLIESVSWLQLVDDAQLLDDLPSRWVELGKLHGHWLSW